MKLSLSFFCLILIFTSSHHLLGSTARQLSRLVGYQIIYAGSVTDKLETNSARLLEVDSNHIFKLDNFNPSFSLIMNLEDVVIFKHRNGNLKILVDRALFDAMEIDPNQLSGVSQVPQRAQGPIIIQPQAPQQRAIQAPAAPNWPPPAQYVPLQTPRTPNIDRYRVTPGVR